MNKIEEPAREGFLYHIWLRRNLPQTLSTISGQKITVLEKGSRNYDAGPDFLNALVRFDDQLERGDIEIHPVAGDWYGHGHHLDPRYDNVILHVVTMNCPPTFETRTHSGRLVSTLNLDDFLEKSAEELEKEAVDEIEPPATTLCGLANQEQRTVARILEKAGESRLLTKVARVAEKRSSDSWDQIFYSMLLEALGYSKNQVPFKNLAVKLPVETIWSTIWNDPPNIAASKCEAYLFGVAGLLPCQSRTAEAHSSDDSSYIRQLEEYWQQFPLRHKIDPLKKENWLFFRLRPVNFPTRRLAAASAWILRFINEGFVAYYRKVFDECLHSEKLLIKELLASITVEASGFWADHYSFDAPVESARRSAKSQFIVGNDRARDILVNVIFPVLLAYAEEANDARLKVQVMQGIHYCPPLTENEITRSMRRKIFGEQGGGRHIIKTTTSQQGLIHLHKLVCRPGECNACLTT